MIFNGLYQFITDIYDKRYTIYSLTKRDFKTMYTGSVLGLTWSFIQPLAMTAIFWFVFTKGFKALPVKNFPFIVWFLCGLIPWNFFSNCLSANTVVIREYSFLVKEANFRVSILPIVKILSALLIHGIFLCILLGLLVSYRMPITIYALQILYYVPALMFLILGLSWLTAALNVFLKDVAQIVGILLQLGFFMSPIFWTPSMFEEPYRTLLKLNPLYYIIEGYRSSFLYHTWVSNSPSSTLYFWVVSSVLVLTSMFVFKQLRRHFADVI